MNTAFKVSSHYTNKCIDQPHGIYNDTRLIEAKVCRFLLGKLVHHHEKKGNEMMTCTRWRAMILVHAT